MLYKKYGIRYFLLADESPQIDAELWEEVLDELIERKLKGAYFGTCARVKDILRDKNIMDKYRKAGFMNILFGAEFTSNKTLNSVLKEQKFDEIKSAVELINSNGMISIVDMMLGWNNDQNEIFETLDDIPKLNADFVCYFWTTPYVWTKSYEELTARYNVDNNYDNYNFMTYFGDNFDQDSIQKELIKSYFSYHFKPGNIIRGFFTGPKEKRRIFRSIFMQGSIKSIVQLYPAMRHVLQRKEVVTGMHYCTPARRWST
jgi:anaerobic magnesium-protoporphyrin IX monomethyl ester cyclase